MPPGKPKQVIPVPAPTVPSATSGPSAPSARSTSVAATRARVGHVAVVALADDGDDDVVGPAARGDDCRLGDGPERVRAA